MKSLARRWLTGLLVLCLGMAGWLGAGYLQDRQGREVVIAPAGDGGFNQGGEELDHSGNFDFDGPEAGSFPSGVGDDFGVSRLVEEVLDHRSTSLPGGGGRVETSIIRALFHEPYLRIESEYLKDSDGTERLVSVSPMVADKVLLRLQEAWSVDRLNAVLAPLEAKVEGVFRNPRLFRIELDSFSSVESLPRFMEAIRLLAGEVEFVEPDYLVRGFGKRIPNDPLFPRQFGFESDRYASLRDINAPEAWAVQRDAESVVVAVIDSGLRVTHEDLAGNLWENASESLNGVDDDGNGIVDDLHGFDAITMTGALRDESGHGSHVGGIIGAVGDNGLGVAGIAWKTQLMGIRFLDSNRLGTVSDSIASIEYAVSKEADILNLSWGTDRYSASLELALTEASDAGLLVVAAAGNDGNQLSGRPTYPASYRIKNQVVVASSNNLGRLSDFSNYDADLVHLAAPQGSMSCIAESDAGYENWHGTSMSAGYVSGALALLKERFPEESSGWLLNRLFDSVRLSKGFASKVSTGGVLDLHRAVTGESNVPINDAFSDATELPGFGGRESGTVALASLEEGESLPVEESGGTTVWYRWLALESGTVNLEFSPLGFEGVVAIYRGDAVSNLQPVDRLLSNPSTLSTTAFFAAEKGATYYFQVDRRSEFGGRFTLLVAPTPVNDDIEDAAVLLGEAFAYTGSNRYGTLEPGEEPLYWSSSGRTVWHSWVAPKEGSVYVNVEAENPFYLKIFEGEESVSLSELATLKENGSLVRQVLDAKKGTRYFFGVDSGSAQGGMYAIFGTYIDVPRIGGEPRDQSVEIGQDATFSVTIFGTGTPRYRWYFNGELMAGEIGSELRIPSVGTDDLGSYHAQVQVAGIELRSRDARLSLNEDGIRVVQKPFGQTARFGEGFRYTPPLDVSGEASYQWFKDGIVIEGQTELRLTIVDMAIEDQGFYHLRVELGSEVYETKPLFIVGSDGTSDEILHLSGAYNRAPGFFEQFEFVGDYFVSYGLSSPVIFTRDGTNWMYAPFPNPDGISGLIYVNGEYYATSRNGIYVSQDLLHWDLVAETEYYVGSLAYGNGRFVAALGEGKVLISENGTDWHMLDLPMNEQVDLISYGNGRFALVSVNGIYQSENGEQWNQVYDQQLLFTKKLAFVDGIWWLYIDDYDHVRHSTDLVNWTHAPLIEGETIYDFTVDQSTGTVLLAMGKAGVWRYGPDGGEQVTKESANAAAANGARVVVGGGSTAGPVETYRPTPRDEDSDAWLSQGEYRSINGMFLNAYDGGYQTVLRVSSDGHSWRVAGRLEDPPFGTDAIVTDFTYGEGLYLGRDHVGPSLAALRPHHNGFSAVSYGQGVFVAQGEELLYSEDGYDWEEATIDVDGAQLQWIGFLNDVFVGLAYNSVFVSPNGRGWELVGSNDLWGSGFAGRAAYGNGRYVVSLGYGHLLLSVDGLVFEERRLSGAFEGLEVLDLEFRDDRFLALTSAGLIASSDGIVWELENRNAAGGRDLLANDDGLLLSKNGLYVLDDAGSASLQVSLKSPSDGSVFSAGAWVDLEFDVVSFGTDIAKTEIYQSGALVGEFDGEVSQFHLGRLEEGEYEFRVVVTGLDGSKAEDVFGLAARSAASPVPARGLPYLRDIIEFKGIVFGSGRGGVVYSTSDGVEWHTHQTPSARDLYYFAKSDVGIVVGDEAGGLVFSPNGVDWILQEGVRSWASSESKPSRGNGLLMMPGQPQSALVSKDGYRWLIARTGSFVVGTPDESLPGGAGILVPRNGTVGYLSTDRVEFPIAALEDKTVVDFYDSQELSFALAADELLRSSNKLNWEVVENVVPDDDSEFMRIDRVGSLFFVIQGNSSSSGKIAFVSADGVAWQRVETDEVISEVVYLDGNYYYSSRNSFYQSSDGVTWTSIGGGAYSQYANGLMNSLVAANFGFLSLEAHDSWRYPRVSVDGEAWSIEDLIIGGKVQAIVGSESSCLIKVGNSDLALKEGPDGLWEPIETTLSRHATHGNGIFVDPQPYGESRKLAVSEDGVAWTILDYPTWLPQDRARACFDGNEYFWIFYDDIVGRSKDGRTWEQMESPSSDIDGVYAYNGELFLIGRNIYRSSSDSLNWSRESVPDFQSAYGLTSTTSRIAALGSDGRSLILFVSEDGSSWSQRVLPDPSVIEVFSDRRKFYARGESLWTSEDCIEWTRLVPNIEGDLRLFETSSRVFAGSSWPNVKELTGKDLSLFSISTDRWEVGVSELVAMSVTVQNEGDRDIRIGAGAWLEVFLSDAPGTLKSIHDGMNSTREIFFEALNLSVGEQATLTFDYLMPERIEPGEYYIGARVLTRALPGEGNRSNDLIVNRGRADLLVPEVELQVVVNGNGKVVSDRTLHKLGKNESVLLVAQALGQEKFVSWSGDVEGLDGSALTVRMDKNRTVIANFGYAYDDWASEQFSEVELEDVEVSGPDADPDENGLTNLWEFASGWRELVPQQRDSLGWDFRDGYLYLRYARSSVAFEVSLDVQSSVDLELWSPEEVTESLLSANDQLEIVEARIAVPSGQAVFLRVDLSRAEE